MWVAVMPMMRWIEAKASPMLRVSTEVTSFPKLHACNDFLHSEIQDFFSENNINKFPFGHRIFLYVIVKSNIR